MASVASGRYQSVMGFDDDEIKQITIDFHCSDKLAEIKIKVADKESELHQTAEVALSQIDDMEYMAEFKNEGISQVWKYGIAFCGKKCAIAA